MIKNALYKTRICGNIRLLHRSSPCKPAKLTLSLRDIRKQSTFQPIVSQFYSSRALFHVQAESSSVETDETIYALSTAPGRAGIAVVRISGSSCLHVRQKSLRRPKGRQKANTQRRSTEPYAHPDPYPNLDWLLYGPSLNQRLTGSWIPMPWSSTFLGQRL